MSQLFEIFGVAIFGRFHQWFDESRRTKRCIRSDTCDSKPLIYTRRGDCPVPASLRQLPENHKLDYDYEHIIQCSRTHFDGGWRVLFGAPGSEIMRVIGQVSRIKHQA